MTPEDLESIRVAIRDEMLSSPIVNDPPPCDNNAEREVMAGLLCGFVRTDELGGVLPKHFVHPIRREVYQYAQSNGSQMQAVEDHLRARGFVGCIDLWLANARDDYPWRGKQSCRDAVRRILEAWRRRQLLDFLSTIQAGLRCGSHTADEAIAALRAKVNPPEQARKSKP